MKLLYFVFNIAMSNVYSERSLSVAAQHLPVGDRLRPVAVPNLRHVHLQGHGMGQRDDAATQHDRILLVRRRPRGILAAGAVDEVNGLHPT